MYLEISKIPSKKTFTPSQPNENVPDLMNYLLMMSRDNHLLISNKIAIMHFTIYGYLE